ncbi:MAG TPA: PLP-dependent aminotransferase family protein [Candidatus Dormibacteraeota bacterium]|nr:PLP-dependent aminotransferase family protein [Candidatus Dormibacteraeota bacterium]
MEYPVDRLEIQDADGTKRRHEAIAAALEAALSESRLKPGDRLPTVRALARHLGVSGASVAAAYELLGRRGLTRGEVGRGTFVSHGSLAGGGSADEPRRRAGEPGEAVRVPWRRALLRSTVSRIEAAHPDAVDCAAGHPDAALLPLALLRRCYGDALASLTHRDLQYAGAEPVGVFADAVAGRLRADGVPARAEDVVVATSSLQLIDLLLGVLSLDERAPLVAVEQPGYPTTHDSVDRHGWRPIAVDVDSEGMEPDSLDSALAAGARLVVFTPRAQNPTGASWTAQRHADLADVLARHPQAIVVEDDHAAGVVDAGPCSLASDERVRDRVVHIRSFSKAIAPDLRITAALVPPSLRAAILEEKSAADGWTSRLSQRAVALMLKDASLNAVLAEACHVYERRRRAASVPLQTPELAATGAMLQPARSGLNLWITLPRGADQAAVLERAAAYGVVVAPGEPFYVSRGHRDAIRFTVGAVGEEAAADAATSLARAILSTTTTRTRVDPV